MNYSKSFNKLLTKVNKRHLQLCKKQNSALSYSVKNKKCHALSLPSQILFKQRARKISEAYKALSSEKGALNSSSSKSKKRLILTPQKKNVQFPFSPYSNNLPKNSNKLKLSLQRTQQSSSFNNTRAHTNDSLHIDSQVRLRMLNDKLDQLLKLKSKENFINEFKSFLEDHNQKQNLKCDLITQSLSKLHKCFEKVKQAVMQQNHQIIFKNRQLQEQITSLKIQVNKSNIKQILFDRNLQKEKQLCKKLQRQLHSYRNKNKKTYVSVSTNTKAENQVFQQEQNHIQSSQNDDFPQQIHDYQRKIKKLNEQLNRFHKVYQTQKKNTKQLIDVLVFLKKEGVEVQQIFENVINGRVDLTQSKSDKKNLQKSLKQVRNQHRQIYKKTKQIKVNYSCDGDNSIISDEQGLSFNYQEKSIEMEKYTFRREQYRCKKQLSNDLKDKLKLNFDGFYQQQDYGDYEDQFQDDEIPNVQNESIIC